MSDVTIYLPAGFKNQMFGEINIPMVSKCKPDDSASFPSKCSEELVISSKRFLQSTANSIKTDYSRSVKFQTVKARTNIDIRCLAALVLNFWPRLYVIFSQFMPLMPFFGH